MGLGPITYDLTAHYEPRAGFAVSPGVRRGLRDLARRHSRFTLMTGRHSGRPTLHTDIKGISVGTRLEVSRFVLRRSARRAVLAEALRLFHEASDLGVASGPVARLLVHFPRMLDRHPERQAAGEAYRDVFGRDCCFLTTYDRFLELGQVVLHQTLLQHLAESGPYHSNHQPRVEAVRSELNKQAGQYENHRFFTRPIPSNGEVPGIEFCYSGEKTNRVVELAMSQKTEEQLVFVAPGEVNARPDDYVSLSDYERGSRRYGTLWVLQNDLVRPLDRQHAAALYLFLDDDLRPEMDTAFDWQQLYDRLQRCSYISRAQRQSPTYLDLMLHKLTRSGFLVEERSRYRLDDRFAGYQHVTFYSMGSFDKRLAKV